MRSRGTDRPTMERESMMKMLLMSLALVATLAAAAPALATCSITGNCAAIANTDPARPGWTYTLVVTWDTGTPYALSHLDLLLDSVGARCSCADMAEGLVLVNPAGTSDGEGGCAVPYTVALECQGDPSIPGVGGILLKFEPNEADCQPAATGTATFTFGSPLPPVPVDEDILSLVDKYGTQHCFGQLTGVFPGMACNPVADEGRAWGAVKGLYR
jgi:hypothetical protein